MDEIEGFRYRARDVLRSITSVLIKEARLKEIKNELLNSEKLKVKKIKISFKFLIFLFLSRTLKRIHVKNKYCDTIKN